MTILMKLAGFYGTNRDNTCNQPQPGNDGHLEISQQVTALKIQPGSNGDVYEVGLTFSSYADSIEICNSDSAEVDERNFFIDAPLELYDTFTQYILGLGHPLITTVGTHSNGYIEFFIQTSL